MSHGELLKYAFPVKRDIFLLLKIILAGQAAFMSTCSTCFEVTLQACPETILVKGGLAPSTDYFWVLTNKFGKNYQRLATTDNEGTLTIDCSFLPDGSLNAYAGAFRLTIRSGADYLTVIPLSVFGENYDCLMVSFAETEGDEGLNNVIVAMPAESSGTVENFTDVTFNDLTGEVTWPEDPAPYRVSLLFTNWTQSEGVAFSIGLLYEQTSEGVTYLTPGDVTFKWRKVLGPPSFAPVSGWNEKIITVTRLQRRWYHLYRSTGSGPSLQYWDTYPGFYNLNIYNVNGDLIGSFTNIDDLIAAWNADPANVNFPIIAYRTLNTFYEVQFEPDASETAYPIQHVTVGF